MLRLLLLIRVLWQQSGICSARIRTTPHQSHRVSWFKLLQSMSVHTRSALALALLCSSGRMREISNVRSCNPTWHCWDILSSIPESCLRGMAAVSAWPRSYLLAAVALCTLLSGPAIAASLPSLGFTGCRTCQIEM